MKYKSECPLDHDLFHGQLGIPAYVNLNDKEVKREMELNGKI